MNDKELNLLEMIRLLLKNKILFLVTFLILLIVSSVYILNMEKIYRSVLIAKFPLNNGFETEYLINVLNTYKANDLNTILKLDNNTIKSISLEKAKYSNDEIYGIVNIETLMPDTSLEVKNKIIAYVNEISFFEKLMKIEKNEKEAMMATKVGIDSLNTENTYYFNPLEAQRMRQKAKKDLAYLAPIVEIQYTPFIEKHKPSYSMLLVVGSLFSLCMALGIVALKIGFSDILEKLNNEQ